MYFTAENHEIKDRIMLCLMKDGAIPEERYPDLYREYTENDEVQLLVKSTAQTYDVTVEKYNRTLYMIPNDNNTFFGFTGTEFARCITNDPTHEKNRVYLGKFCIMVLFSMFFSGNGQSAQSLEFVRFEELMNRISQELKNAETVTGNNQIEQETGIRYTDILHEYESLAGDEENTAKKKTKAGFIRTILRMLEKQKLFDFIDKEEIIFPTQRCIDLMNYKILNEERVEYVRSLFGGGLDELLRRTESR